MKIVEALTQNENVKENVDELLKKNEDMFRENTRLARELEKLSEELATAQVMITDRDVTICLLLHHVWQKVIEEYRKKKKNYKAQAIALSMTKEQQE